MTFRRPLFVRTGLWAVVALQLVGFAVMSLAISRAARTLLEAEADLYAAEIANGALVFEMRQRLQDTGDCRGLELRVAPEIAAPPRSFSP